MILTGNCLNLLKTNQIQERFNLTFLDPPFNQNKVYASYNDDLPEDEYWAFMQQVCTQVFRLSTAGAALYFMQREKNTEQVLRCLRESGWQFHNLIIWKKKTSAVPCSNKFGKHYQVIAFASKGERTSVFHRLRISPPLPPHYKKERENGIYVTDVWDDNREMTSGYFAGDEALRDPNGERYHKQQSPIALLLRIILSSTNVGDMVFDPFAGTGTTLVVAKQLGRKAIGIELDPENAARAQQRLEEPRSADNIQKYYQDYTYTENLEKIWVDQTSI